MLNLGYLWCDGLTTWWQGDFASSRQKEVSMATLWVATTKDAMTLIQSLEYLPNWYIQELEVEGTKSFQYSNQNGRAIGQLSMT